MVSDVERELLVAMAAHSTALRLLHAAGGDVEQLRAAVVVAHEREVDRLALGAVLRRIHDERLYRATHRSFEGYVLDVVGVSRSTAYRLIAKETP